MNINSSRAARRRLGRAKFRNRRRRAAQYTRWQKREEEKHDIRRSSKVDQGSN